MNMISQLPATVRNQVIGYERVKPVVAVVQPTENAVKYHDYEAAMLKEAARLRKRRIPVEPTLGDSRTNEVKAAECRALILAQLDTPKTARQIGDAIGRGDGTVTNRLRAMREMGLVDYTAPKSQTEPFIWRKAERPNVTANLARGHASRMIVLEAVNNNTTAQIAEVIGRSPRQLMPIMRQLERDGFVVRNGRGPKPEKGAAPRLWLRA